MDGSIKKKMNISLVQYDIAWGDKRKNIEIATHLIRQIKDLTDIIVLPEMFNTGFAVQNKNLAENADGESLQWMQSVARSTMAAVVGTVFVIDNGLFYNRLFWVLPDGNYYFYNKRHLFRFGNENELFSNGNSKLIVNYKGWNFLPLICYDLRFPVWSKNSYDQSKFEYDVLLYSANWPARRQYAWKSLLIARAIENLSYVVAVNRTGTDANGVPHSGDSVILDYKGKPLTDFINEMDCCCTYAIDYDELVRYREGFNVGLDWDRVQIDFNSPTHL